MSIDRKFRIKAYNLGSGEEHSEEDAVLFLARDKALLYTLLDYRRNCKELGTGPDHIKGINLLIGRVRKYQQEHGSKIPDTDPVTEWFVLEE